MDVKALVLSFIDLFTDLLVLFGLEDAAAKIDEVIAKIDAAE